MKLYDGGRAPNPRRVRIFLAEKSIAVPLVPVDLGKLEHKSADYATVNPLRRVPALALDDGTVLTESIAICRYFEELQPEPALFGRTPLEKAQVEMWNRRLEFNLFQSVQHVFRHTHPGMKELEGTQVAAWAEVNRPRVIDFLALFDEALKRWRFAAGDAFSVADITGLVAIDLMKPAKLAVPEELAHVRRWHAEIAARPSAQA